MESRVVANRQVVTGNAGSKIVDGRLVEKPTLDFALGAIEIRPGNVLVASASRVSTMRVMVSAFAKAN